MERIRINYEVTCECRDCGKKFYLGQEGDNEEYCLKCEHRFLQKIEERAERGDEDDLTDDHVTMLDEQRIDALSQGVNHE